MDVPPFALLWLLKDLYAVNLSEHLAADAHRTALEAGRFGDSLEHADGGFPMSYLQHPSKDRTMPITSNILVRGFFNINLFS